MNPTNKKILSYGVAIITGVIAYQLAYNFIFKSASFEEQLLKMSGEVNKNCPMMIDSNTRLDNVVGGPGKCITYNYTLINHAAQDLNIVELKQNMTPVLTNTIRTSEEMQNLRREKVNFKYNYKDKLGVFLFSITIEPRQYIREP